MDESNIKDSGFLERMNTLLANGEVPGLFEGDEYTTLMTQCKEGAQRMGQMLDSSEELYKWFTSQVGYLPARWVIYQPGGLFTSQVVSVLVDTHVWPTLSI